jgi:hypothetical protein
MLISNPNTVYLVHHGRNSRRLSRSLAPTWLPSSPFDFRFKLLPASTLAPSPWSSSSLLVHRSKLLRVSSTPSYHASIACPPVSISLSHIEIKRRGSSCPNLALRHTACSLQHQPWRACAGSRRPPLGGSISRPFPTPLNYVSSISELRPRFA